MSTAWWSEAAGRRWRPAALNGGWIYRDRIGAADGGCTALAYYIRRHPHSDATTWRQRLAAGEIRRGDAVLAGEERLASGDRLRWHRPPWWEEAVPELGDCLFDDGDLLVLDKPAGLPVLPAGGWLEHTVLRLLEHRHRGDPAGLPRPVHRLGRFTAGLLVCARRPSTRAWLSAALRESTAGGWGREPRPRGGSVRKLYRALLVPGALALAEGESRTVGSAIGRRPHPRLGWIWCAALEPRAGDLAALSTLTLLERHRQADLVQVAIETGRPHQIRIHCAAVGAPLLGDPLYRPGGLADGEALPGDGGYRLQAWRLELRHPRGDRLVLEAPAPLRVPAGGRFPGGQPEARDRAAPMPPGALGPGGTAPPLSGTP